MFVANIYVAKFAFVCTKWNFLSDEHHKCDFGSDKRLRVIQRNSSVLHHTKTTSTNTTENILDNLVHSNIGSPQSHSTLKPDGRSEESLAINQTTNCDSIDTASTVRNSKASVSEAKSNSNKFVEKAKNISNEDKKKRNTRSLQKNLSRDSENVSHPTETRDFGIISAITSTPITDKLIQKPSKATDKAGAVIRSVDETHTSGHNIFNDSLPKETNGLDMDQISSVENSTVIDPQIDFTHMQPGNEKELVRRLKKFCTSSQLPNSAIPSYRNGDKCFSKDYTNGLEIFKCDQVLPSDFLGLWVKDKILKYPANAIIHYGHELLQKQPSFYNSPYSEDIWNLPGVKDEWADYKIDLRSLWNGAAFENVCYTTDELQKFEM